MHETSIDKIYISRAFQSFWNGVEVFILCLCIGAIIMFFYRLFIGQVMEDDIHADPYTYHNFQYLIIWDEVSTNLPLSC